MQKLITIITLFFAFSSHAREFIPQLAIFTPSRLVDDHQEEVSGIPLVAVNLSHRITESGNYHFFLRERLSFFHKQFFSDTQELIRLNGFNLQSSLDLRYRTSFSVDPGFTFGVGGLLLHHNAPTHDFVFLAPQITFGPTMHIVHYDRHESFMGISFAIEYTRVIFSENPYQGVSVNVGVHFSI